MKDAQNFISPPGWGFNFHVAKLARGFNRFSGVCTCRPADRFRTQIARSDFPGTSQPWAGTGVWMRMRKPENRDG